MFRNLILEACLNEKKITFEIDRKHENEPNEKFPKILSVQLTLEIYLIF
jgi:hypothetical protein